MLADGPLDSAPPPRTVFLPWSLATGAHSDEPGVQAPVMSARQHDFLRRGDAADVMPETDIEVAAEQP